MRLAVFDVGGTAIKYAAMTDGEMDGKGEVPTPATCSGDFLAAIEGVLDALRAEGDIEGVALSLPGVLDPERVCLGGGVSRNLLFVEGVRAAHRRFNEGLSYAFPEVEIMPCRFFNDTNLIGAYQNFLARR